MMASDNSNTVRDDRSNDPSTEQTPLLGDRPTSPDVESTANGHSGNGNASPDPNKAKVQVGPLRAVAIGISLYALIFLQASNMSGITVIQGSIAADLDAYEGTLWFTSGYLITMSSLGPLMGKFAAIFSPRRLILPISFFIATGGLISAHAQTFESFLLGRVVMGIGGAGVMTLAVILVLDLTSEKRRGLVLGVVNAGISISVSLGGVVYGALLSVVGWRAMFWIQCPVSAVSGIALFLSLPRKGSTAPKSSAVSSMWQKLRRIDYLGSIILIAAIVCFLYGLSGKIEPLYLIICLALLVIFVLVESYLAVDPVIPLRVLRSRGVLLSCIAQLGLLSARWTVLYYVPIFMLATRGESRAQSGSMLIPTNLGFALGGMLVGWLHIRRSGSFWLPCLISIALFSVFMWLLGLVATPGVPLAVLVIVVFAGGLATGAAVNYTLAHLLHHSHDGTQYITTSLFGTFRGFGGAFGTSIAGGIFSRLLQGSLTEGFLSLDGEDHLSPERKRLVSQLLGAPELVYGGGLDGEERQIAIDAYAGASRGTWMAAAVLGIVVLALQAGTGWRGPKQNEKHDETEAHAIVEENEGVGEA